MDIEKRLREIMTVEDPGVQVTDAVMSRVGGREVPGQSGTRSSRGSGARARRNRFVVVGMVVSALAAAAAWQLSNRQTLDGEAAVGGAAIATLPLEASESGTTATAPVVLAPETDNQPVTAGAREGRAASGVVVDPDTVVVIMRPEVAAGVSEIALADRCFDAVTTELRGLGGLNVVTDSSSFRMTSPSEALDLPGRDREIALGHGAGHVLRVTTAMGCDFTLFDSQTGSGTGAGGGGVDPQGARASAFAKAIALSVHHHILGDRVAEPSASRIRLLNSRLSDRDRMTALAEHLQARRSGPRNPGSARPPLGADVLAAVTQLGTKSPDAGVRSAVWAMLREANDPGMIQPLLQTILNDTDRTVRYQAIQTIRKFLDAPGVREALQHVATMDPDSQPERFCCTATVREAAERASVPDPEFLAWVRRKLLDESQPGRSRLINLMGISGDGRFAGGFSRVGNDLAAVVLEIAQRDPDPRVRAMAWDVMYSGQAEREFLSEEAVPVLLKDLQTSVNERVRAGAARILYGFRDNPEVEEAIQRALADDSIMVRRAATGAGMAPVSAE